MVGGCPEPADVAVALAGTGFAGVVDRSHAAQRVGGRLPLLTPPVGVHEDLRAGPDRLRRVESGVGSQSGADEVAGLICIRPVSIEWPGRADHGPVIPLLELMTVCNFCEPCCRKSRRG